MSTAVATTRADRRARLAVSLMFLTNGALFANLIPRYPEIKAALGLDNTAYGLTVIAWPVGAILAGLAAAVLIRRFGSAAVALAGTVLTGAAIVAASAAPGVAVLVAFLLLGGAMAAVAIALGVPITVHVAISGGLLSVVALVAFRLRLPGRDVDEDEEAIADAGEVRGALRAGIPARIVVTLVALVVIATAGAIVEDAGNSWATLYLADSLGAPAALAATGFVALVGAQFVGRLVGDRLVDRFGQRTVARIGGLVAAIGMGLALVFPSVPATIVGFAAAGLGVATLVPAAMQQADDLPGLRRGTGLTVVSWLMRLGFVLSPPLVGLVADAVSLRAALAVVPIAGLVVVATAGVLVGRAPRPR